MMVTALVNGKRIEIKNLDDLSKAVQESQIEREPLMLLGDHEERFEIPPTSTLTGEERLEALRATYGSWKGLVDTELLKRNVYSSRGQEGRDWYVYENENDGE